MNYFNIFADDASTVSNSTSNFTWDTFWDTVITWCTNTGIKLIIAILILIISFIIIHFVYKKVIKKFSNNKKLDKTIVKTFTYVGKILLEGAIVVALIAYLGIDTSIFTAVFGSFSVCIGLAVNGTLSNIAGGVMILLTRPFRVDDYIEAGSYSGTVEDIHLNHTVLKTPDNKVVYVPNGTLSSQTIVNYSMKDTRRLEILASASYNADINKTKEVLLKVCNSNKFKVAEIPSFVALSNQADSALVFTCRIWVKNSQYWDAYFSLNEEIKNGLDKAGIEIPYNQLDVHVRND